MEFLKVENLEFWIIANLLDNLFNKKHIINLEGGGALPEDTSREGCGVGTPEIGKAVER